MRIHQYSAQLHFEFVGALAEAASDSAPSLWGLPLSKWRAILDDLAMMYIAGGEL